jgi:hypothetical protein
MMVRAEVVGQQQAVSRRSRAVSSGSLAVLLGLAADIEGPGVVDAVVNTPDRGVVLGLDVASVGVAVSLVSQLVATIGGGYHRVDRVLHYRVVSQSIRLGPFPTPFAPRQVTG